MATQRGYEGSTAYAVALERFKVPTRLLEKTVLVPDEAIEILDNNPRRLAWGIVNRGLVNAVIGFTQAMTLYDGILLAPEGGCAIMTVEEDGESVGYAVYGMMYSGVGAFYVYETVAI